MKWFADWWLDWRLLEIAVGFNGTGDESGAPGWRVFGAIGPLHWAVGKEYPDPPRRPRARAARGGGSMSDRWLPWATTEAPFELTRFRNLTRLDTDAIVLSGIDEARHGEGHYLDVDSLPKEDDDA